MKVPSREELDQLIEAMGVTSHTEPGDWLAGEAGASVVSVMPWRRFSFDDDADGEVGEAED